MKKLRWIWLVGAAIMASSPVQADDALNRAITVQMIERHIQPRFKRFASAAADLQSAVASACKQSGDLERATVGPAFQAAVVAWTGTTHLRWGPAQVDSRSARISFGSDPKNYAIRQMRKLLAKQAPDSITLDEFAKKSIALQGLSALERLIYQEPLDSSIVAARCPLALLIGGNLSAMSTKLESDWTDPKAYPALLLSPGPENPRFRTAAESTMEMFKPLSGGLRYFIDLKLKDPLRKTVKGARPRHTEYRYSGLTNMALAATLKALGELYLIGGFADATRKSDPQLDEKIQAGFARALQQFSSLSLPLPKAVKDPAGRAQITDLIATLEGLWKLIAFDMARKLSLQVGFNEFDGD